MYRDVSACMHIAPHNVHDTPGAGMWRSREATVANILCRGQTTCTCVKKLCLVQPVSVGHRLKHFHMAFCEAPAPSTAASGESTVFGSGCPLLST